MRCFPVHSISQRRASLMDGSRWTLINFFHVVSVTLSPDFGDLSNAWLLFSLDAVHIIRSVTLSWIVQGFKDGVISFGYPPQYSTMSRLLSFSQLLCLSRCRKYVPCPFPNRLAGGQHAPNCLQSCVRGYEVRAICMIWDPFYSSRMAPLSSLAALLTSLHVWSFWRLILSGRHANWSWRYIRVFSTQSALLLRLIEG